MNVSACHQFGFVEQESKLAQAEDSKRLRASSSRTGSAMYIEESSIPSVCVIFVAVNASVWSE